MAVENSEFNFSIQETMGAGVGNTQLLSDLFADSASGNPDDVTPIIKEVEDDDEGVDSKSTPPAKTKTPAVPGKGKTSKTAVSEEEEDDDDEEGANTNKNKNPLLDFMSATDDDDEEEEDEEEVITGKKPGKKSASVTEDEDDDDEESSSPFPALSKDLFKLGIFTQDEDEEEEEEISTPEQFLERFKSEKQKGAIQIVNDFIGQFGEDYQSAFQAIFVKGVDPKEYFANYDKVVSFAEMDLSKEDNQRRILRQALTDQGFDEDDIKTEIERLTNYGDLEQVATKYHKVLVKKEATKLADLEKAAEETQRQKTAYKEQYIQNVNTILKQKIQEKEYDGIPLNPKLASELQDFLLVDKYRTPAGENLTEFDKTILDLKKPENHALKVKVALLLKVLEKDPTLSTIQKTGVTKKSGQLFDELARHKEKPITKQKKNSSSWFQ